MRTLTLDERHPASPTRYYTTTIVRLLVHEIMSDSYYQQCCRGLNNQQCCGLTYLQMYLKMRFVFLEHLSLSLSLLYISIYVYLSIYLSFYLSICLSVHPYIHLYIRLPASQPLHPEAPRRRRRPVVCSSSRPGRCPKPSGKPQTTHRPFNGLPLTGPRFRCRHRYRYRC